MKRAGTLILLFVAALLFALKAGMSTSYDLKHLDLSLVIQERMKLLEGLEMGVDFSPVAFSLDISYPSTPVYNVDVNTYLNLSFSLLRMKTGIGLKPFMFPLSSMTAFYAFGEISLAAFESPSIEIFGKISLPGRNGIFDTVFGSRLFFKFRETSAEFYEWQSELVKRAIAYHGNLYILDDKDADKLFGNKPFLRKLPSPVPESDVSVYALLRAPYEKFYVIRKSKILSRTKLPYPYATVKLFVPAKTYGDGSLNEEVVFQKFISKYKTIKIDAMEYEVRGLRFLINSDGGVKILYSEYTDKDEGLILKRPFIRKVILDVDGDKLEVPVSQEEGAIRVYLYKPLRNRVFAYMTEEERKGSVHYKGGRVLYEWEDGTSMEYKGLNVTVIPDQISLPVEKVAIKAATVVSLSFDFPDCLPDFDMKTSLQGKIYGEKLEEVVEVDRLEKKGDELRLVLASDLLRKRWVYNGVSMILKSLPLYFKVDGDFEAFGDIERVTGGFRIKLERMSIRMKTLNIGFSDKLTVLSKPVNRLLLEPHMRDSVLRFAGKTFLIYSGSYAEVPVRDVFGNFGRLKLYTSELTWIKNATELTLRDEEFEYRVDGEFVLIPDISRLSICPEATLTLEASTIVDVTDHYVCVDGDKVYEAYAELEGDGMEIEVRNGRMIIENATKTGVWGDFELRRIGVEDEIYETGWKVIEDIRLHVLPSLKGMKVYLDLEEIMPVTTSLILDNYGILQFDHTLVLKSPATSSVISDNFGNEVWIENMKVEMTEPASSGVSRVSFKDGKLVVSNFSKPGNYNLSDEANVVVMRSSGLDFAGALPFYLTVTVSEPATVTIEATSETITVPSIPVGESTETKEATSME